MFTENSDRAEVLVEALPYIQKYYGKVVVVKYGGNAMINEDLKNAVMRDIVLLSLVGVKVVLVHGGGPEISDMLKKVGKQSEFVDGLRVTDKETVDIVQMVLAGKVNKNLVNRVNVYILGRYIFQINIINLRTVLHIISHYRRCNYIVNLFIGRIH